MRAILRAAVVFATVVGLDQGAKALVRHSIERGDENAVFPAVTLVNTRNTGVAFGLFSNGGLLVAVVTGLALTALLVFFWLHRERPLAWLPTGLLLGGAAGNLIDRLREQAVTDFVKLPLWPAFNIADVAITFGVLSLLYVLEGPPKRHG